MPGPGRVQDSGPSDRRCCGGRAPLSWPGWETGHLVSLTSQGERPRPRYLPGAGTFPSSPPQLLQGTMPPLGWGSQGLPLPFTACWVLPTCPHVGALWPEAQVSGQCQTAQLPHFCTAVPLLPPLEAGGRPEAEVGLASHATSLPETLRLPSTATFRVSPSNPCHPPGNPKAISLPRLCLALRRPAPSPLCSHLSHLLADSLAPPPPRPRGSAGRAGCLSAAFLGPEWAPWEGRAPHQSWGVGPTHLALVCSLGSLGVTHPSKPQCPHL